MAGRAAIYHFTEGAEARPGIYQKELDRLKDFARQHGYTDVEVFCDKSTPHNEFLRMMDESYGFDAVIAKDFYHLNKHTMQCFEVLKRLSSKGTEILTVQDGSFHFTEPPLTADLTAATYTSRGKARYTEQAISLQNAIFKSFVAKKTSWTLQHQYSDISETQRDGDLIQLQELIKDRQQYDLLLVRNLNDISRRTSNFCRVRNALQLDILSLQDGYLPYAKGHTT